MKKAFLSLAIAVFVVFLGAGIAWLYLKSKAANSVPPKPLSTSFFDSAAQPMMFVRTTDLSIIQITSLDPKFGFWIDVQITRDSKVVMLSDRELPNLNYNPQAADRSPETQMKNLSVRYLNWSDVHKLKPEARLLEEILPEDSSRRVILNVVEYAPGADVILSEIVSKLKADEKIILHSDQEGLLADLRKVEPMWLYGTSRAQIVQTLWLTTLGLQGIAPLKGDVLITSYRAGENNQKTILLTPELVAEARRRSMKVLVGPVTKAESEEVNQLGVDGIITSEPQL